VTLPAIPRIDWRRQFQALEPYFADRGGVVHVKVSEASPASNFSKAIRQLMLGGQWTHPWKCVQVEALNSNTHYLEDIVVQLERSLELGLETASLVAGGVVQVGTDIKADSVEISNVDISTQEDDYVRVHRSYARFDRVADAIRERLETERERIALLFLNSHTYGRDTLSDFRRLLWDTQLQTLTDSGLLLIDISDPSRGCEPDWPPDPDLLLDLPERFDDASHRDAHTDLVKFALAEEIAASADGADMFATTLLDASDTIRDVYAGLARILARRAEST
jgi:hypothetical protein